MRRSCVFKTATVLVAGLIFNIAFGRPAYAVRTCFCHKADVAKNIARQRCGKVNFYDPQPGGRYQIEEDDRGQTDLPANTYQECEQPNACPLKGEREVQSCPVIAGAESFGIHGSNTIGEKLIPRLIAGYAKDLRLEAKSDVCNGEIPLFDRRTPHRPSLTIECEAKGTETGISALVDEKADFAMLSRPIREIEIEQMRKKGFPGITTALHEHVLALDALSIVVAERNPVPALSLDQIADIFSQSDRANNWSKIGGGGSGAIRLYLRDEKSGTREMFDEMVMAPRKSTLPSCNQSNVRCFSSSSELVKAVADDPRGIGFVSYAYQSNVKVVPVVEQCGLEQAPSRFDIKTEDYLLSRRLYLYTAKVHSIHSPNFLIYALSDAAQPTIADVGYVDQRVDAQSARETEERIARYTPKFPTEDGLEFDRESMRLLQQETKGATRLSVSFRFRFNSTMLDTKALQDVNRLAEFLTIKAPRSKVVLLGFTDSEGDFKSNLQLSRSRAKAVEAALLAAGIPRERVVMQGYSELMPVACNNRAAGKVDEEGRAKNRRVEAWLLQE